MDGYVAKPVNVDRLFETIAEVLETLCRISEFCARATREQTGVLDCTVSPGKSFVRRVDWVFRRDRFDYL